MKKKTLIQAATILMLIQLTAAYTIYGDNIQNIGSITGNGDFNTTGRVCDGTQCLDSLDIPGQPNIDWDNITTGTNPLASDVSNLWTNATNQDAKQTILFNNATAQEAAIAALNATALANMGIYLNYTSSCAAGEVYEWGTGCITTPTGGSGSENATNLISDNPILIKPSGDTDDYLSFSTPSDQPTININGGDAVFIKGTEDTTLLLWNDNSDSFTMSIYNTTDATYPKHGRLKVSDTDANIYISPNGENQDHFVFSSDGTDLTLATTDTSDLIINPSSDYKLYLNEALSTLQYVQHYRNVRGTSKPYFQEFFYPLDDTTTFEFSGGARLDGVDNDNYASLRVYNSSVGGDLRILNAKGSILLMPNKDTDDYLSLSTVSDVPYLSWIGNGGTSNKLGIFVGDTLAFFGARQLATTPPSSSAGVVSFRDTHDLAYMKGGEFQIRGILGTNYTDTSDKFRFQYASKVSNSGDGYAAGTGYISNDGGENVYFYDIAGTNWNTVHADAFTEHTQKYNGSLADIKRDLKELVEGDGHPVNLAPKETKEKILNDVEIEEGELGTNVGLIGRANSQAILEIIESICSRYPDDVLCVEDSGKLKEPKIKETITTTTTIPLTIPKTTTTLISIEEGGKEGLDGLSSGTTA